MPKEAIQGKPVADHSNKDCCCGGHSHHDHKESRTHHGTRSRMNIRKTRTIMKDIREGSEEAWALRMAEIEDNAGGFPGVTGALVHKSRKCRS